MHPNRPIPIDLKLADLTDELWLECPSCHGVRQLTRYQILDRFPRFTPATLVIRIAAAHYCARCSTGGLKVRPIAEIAPAPRSGAEGGHLTQWAK